MGRKLSIMVGAFVALLIVLYFVATSSAFVKAFVLPRVGNAIGAELSAASVSLSPFSQVVLQNVRLRTTGTEPLVTAEEAKVRYDLFAILRGTIDVEEVSLIAPQVHIFTDADGKSTLDALLKKTGTPSAKTEKSTQTPRLNVRNVSLKNGTVRMVAQQKDGTTQTIELDNLNLGLDQLRNGGHGKIHLSSEVKFEQGASSTTGPATNRAQAKLSGDFDLGLDAQLMPTSAKGALKFDLAKAEGVFKELAGLGGSLQAEATPAEIRQLALRFERGGKGLGSIVTSGPFDLEKREARLKIEVQSIDRQVLNLLGAAHGWDFGDSTVNFTGTVEVTQKGTSIAASGRVAGSRMSVRQTSGVTPQVDLKLEYQAAVNLDQKTALIEKLNLSGQENQKDLLQVSLDRPMLLNWGTATASIPDSTLRLVVHDLNLQSWQSFLGTNLPSGRVNLQLNVQAQKDGKKLGAKLNGDIQELAAKIGTNRIERAQARFDLSGDVTDLRVVIIDHFRFDLLLANQSVASSAGSLRYDLSKSEMSLKTDSEASVADLLKPFPVTNLKASSGRIKSSSTVTQSGPRQTASGQVQLANFTASFGAYDLRDFQTVLDYSVEIAGNEVQLQRAHATFSQSGQAGGSMDVSGRYHLTNSAAQVAFKLADLNQQLLRPFLNPSLGGLQLVSGSLNGGGTASYDPSGDSAMKAELRVANLVVEDPAKKLPRMPLSAEVQVDSAHRKQTVELRQFALKLSPTARAQNQLQLKGRLDFSPTNATPSQLTLQAESLDLTPFYDLFAGTSATNQPASKPQPALGSASEAPPISLPFQQLSADLSIGRCYLRDIAVTNLLAKAQIHRGELTVKPLQFALNGAPVSASAVLNLSVPGYKYDVALKADKVPLEPLASTFGGRTGRSLHGTLLADAQIKGVGISGAALQKNLSGQLALSLTNLNFEIVGKKTKSLLEPIALVLRVPELTLTPLDWVSAKADVSQGKVNVGQFSVLSQAFFANGQGTVQLAPVLTDSVLNIPVALSLRRSLAEKAHLMPPGTPTNAAYVQLPTFAKLTGTLGDSKTEIDKLVISGLLLQSAGGISQIGEKIGAKTGLDLQKIGGLLSGQKPNTGTNAQPATNAKPSASTNKPPRFNPFDLLDLVPKKK